MWVLWPGCWPIRQASPHGEPLPQRLVERLKESRSYGEGFATTSTGGVAAGFGVAHGGRRTAVDDGPSSAEALRKACGRGRGAAAVSQHVLRARVHNGYSAGYSYIWSEVLDADTVVVRENGGLTRANGDRFRQLLAKGGVWTRWRRSELPGRAEDRAALERRGLTGA